MKIFILLLLFSLFTTAATASAELVVIGNLENEVSSLNQKQVQEIFLGRTRSFKNGKRVVPFEVAGLRATFYEKLTRRSIEQINAYWARLLFSGRSTPPSLLSNQEMVIEAVKNRPGGIAYVESEYVDKTQVKVLFVVE